MGFFILGDKRYIAKVVMFCMQCGRDIPRMVLPVDVSDAPITEVRVAMKVDLDGISTVRNKDGHIVGFVCSKACGDCLRA
jgi:hypothetical protein